MVQVEAVVVDFLLQALSWEETQEQTVRHGVPVQVEGSEAAAAQVVVPTAREAREAAAATEEGVAAATGPSRLRVVVVLME
jgi:hypothetical protein